MKSYFAVIAISLTAAWMATGCAQNSTQNIPVTTTGTYSISNVFNNGVEDGDAMDLDIQGTFAPTTQAVAITCDGVAQPTTILSATQTDIVVQIPAASFYNQCQFTVQTGGVNTPTLGVSTVTGLEIDSSTATQINSTTDSVELDGFFFATDPTTWQNSNLSVVAQCRFGSGSYGAAFNPSISIGSTSSTEQIFFDVPRSKGTQCKFTVEDTFTDVENNTVIVDSSTVTTSMP